MYRVKRCFRCSRNVVDNR